MKRKLLSLLALLCLTVSGARADWNGGTYTATTDEFLGSITVNDDATLTINQGVTVDTRDITIADGKTLTIECTAEPTLLCTQPTNRRAVLAPRRTAPPSSFPSKLQSVLWASPEKRYARKSL